MFGKGKCVDVYFYEHMPSNLFALWTIDDFTIVLNKIGTYYINRKWTFMCLILRRLAQTNKQTNGEGVQEK